MFHSQTDLESNFW